MTMRRLGLWKELVHSYRHIATVRWLVLGIGVGCASGLAAVAFFGGIEYFKHLFQVQLAGLELPAPAGEQLFHGHPGGDNGIDHPYRPWMIPVLTTLVGLVTGFFVARVIPESVEAGTDGTDSMIKAFHHQRGIIRPYVPIIKGVTSVFTIASGGSAGREGPISQIGAGIGSYVATKIGLTEKERRILLLAGAAGGLGAVFRAPLGGALTAIEVIYREDFEAEAILPAVLSSVVAYTIFALVFGTEPMFGIPEFTLHSILEGPFYLALAFFCSFTGWLYVKSFYYIKYSVFARIRARIGIMWTTTLGGLCMGLLGMHFPQLLSGGYGWLEMAILGQIAVPVMCGIILGKILATAVTIGSGLSGGMFAPALFVGGMSGGVVGYLGNQYYPNIVVQPGGFVLVGMAAFFAGVANAPIGPLIMVCELTQGYGLLAPLMLCSAICLAINRNVSLYEHQVDNKFESPAHIEDMTINVLEQLHVGDYISEERPTILEEAITLQALTDIIPNTNTFYFPVKNDKEEITGILSIQDVRNLLYEDALFDLILVKDLAKPPALLTPDDDLYTALLKFVDTDLGQIPVVTGQEGDEAHQIIGVINRSDVFHAYSQAIKKIREE